MKKTFLILALILFSSSAFAGSCPMLWAEIDSKIEEIQKLRDDGKKAHDKYYSLTYSQLSDWGVKFHKLIMGKPSGDLYVDDKGVKDEEFFGN